MSDRATEKQLLDEENKQGQDNSGGGDDVKIGSVKPPFLKPFPQGQERYTLVLDLDETLVHYQEVRSRFPELNAVILCKEILLLDFFLPN